MEKLIIKVESFPFRNYSPSTTRSLRQQFLNCLDACIVSQGLTECHSNLSYLAVKGDIPQIEYRMNGNSLRVDFIEGKRVTNLIIVESN